MPAKASATMMMGSVFMPYSRSSLWYVIPFRLGGVALAWLALHLAASTKPGHAVIARLLGHAVSSSSS